MVHSQKASFGLPSTVFDTLSAYEKKVSLTLSSFTSTLTSRQLLYLNMAIRTKINKEHPDWDRLHLVPESPFKAELEVLPTLEAGSWLPELKAQAKKGVMAEVIKAK